MEDIEMLVKDKLYAQGYEQILKTIKETAESVNAQVYLVGGAVRDLLTGRHTTDLDFVVFGMPYDEFAKLVAKTTGRWAVPFKDNMRVPLGKCRYVDISAPRGATIEEDLARRDFTINNLAISMDLELVGDPSDIENKRIVPAFDGAFDDDPLRIVRGFRMASILGFSLSDEFKELAKEKIGLLSNVSGERIYEELRKFSLGEYTGIELISEMTGVFTFLAGCSVEPKDIYGVMHFDGIDVNEFERFVLMLAAVFGECSNRDKALAALKPSRAVQHLAEKLMDAVDGFASDIQKDEETAKKTVWTHQEIFSTLAVYAAVRLNLPEEVWKRAVNIYGIIKSSMTELLKGKDILEIAAFVAPNFRTGPWIAQVMDDVNYRLTFNMLEQEQARKYAGKEIVKRRDALLKKEKENEEQ